MAFTFPLSTSAFFDKLKVVSATPFYLPETMTYSQTQSGELIAADVGVRLWKSLITVTIRRHTDAKEIRSLMHLLSSGGRTFFAYDPTVPYPAADPQGLILGASTPQINSLNVNNRELTVKGLPVGYELSAGDMLAFSYSASPTRYALHQVVTGGVANGSGITPSIEVMPAIRPGAAVNANITLKKPSCKMMFIPGTLNMGSSDVLFTSGIQFECQQTLR